jgi:ComEC/Rec2-related protein
MKQPMAGVAILFALGIGVGHFVPASPLGVAAAAWLAASVSLLGRRHVAGWLAVSLVLAGWADYAHQTAVVSPFDLRETTSEQDQLVTLHGTLRETPQLRLQGIATKRSTNAYAILDAHLALRPDGRVTRVTGPVLVSTPGQPDAGFHAGRRVAVSGVLRLPPLPQAPRLFNYREHLALRGVHRELRAPSYQDWQLLDPEAATHLPWADRFQTWARETLARGSPEEDDALRLLWAMTLGWKTALVDEVEEPFLRSGTMHVFAISGLHVALIVNVLVQALRLLLVPRFLAGILVLPTIWLYVAATGWQSSAVRSAVMSSILLASWMCSRPVDLLNSLATAAFGVLAWDPSQLFQAGFQLSFAVVAAIGLLVPQFEARLRGFSTIDPFLADDAVPTWRRTLDKCVRWIGMHLSVSVAAWIGSVPLSASYFHLVTFSGLAANLVVVPLSSFALASSLASLACGHWLPSIGECFNHGAWFWMAGMLNVSRWCADLPYGCLQVPSPSPALIALAYGTLVLVTRPWWKEPQRRLPIAVSIVGLVGVVAVEGWFGRHDLRIGVLAMRGGHSICVQAPHGTSVLDAGDAPGARTLVHPYLRTLGVNRVQDLWLSHGDVRHVGGVPELVQRYAPQAVVIGPGRFRSTPYRGIVEALRTNTPHLLRTAHDGVRIGPWNVLHPAVGDNFSQADDASLVLQFPDASGHGLLVMGDLGRPGQETFMRRHPKVRADVVICGLPTRGEPLCDGLLDQLQPRLVIVADASSPATARATAQCQARIRARAVPVWFTSESGSLELEQVRGRWTIQDARGNQSIVPLSSSQNPGHFR